MTYIDGTLCAVKTADKETYKEYAEDVGAVFKEYGALNIVDCWGDDIPDGKMNSFNSAVMREPNETVVFSWIAWPSKAVRDAAWEKVMKDPRVQRDMPFDGARLIYGGFDVLADV
ncbi:MAG: DUF1428 domain-containing protein [Pseudomonadota bacterium]